MKGTKSAAWLAASMLVLAACALDVRYEPAALTAPAAAPRAFETTRATEVRLWTGYSRTIAQGVRLVDAGTIPQGRVLRPANTVFTVEGANVHEAYAVVHEGRLVGFYLPFERAFTPLPSPADFPLKESSP